MLTVKEAAKRLGGVSPSLVYALVASGRLGHYRVGLGRGTIRIPEEAVQRYLEAARDAADNLPERKRYDNLSR